VKPNDQSKDQVTIAWLYSEAVSEGLARSHSSSAECSLDQCAKQKKARQTCKIGELRDALIASGVCALDEQASALGLPRSTTWTILKCSHKASGLSAAIINRMLAAPALPPLARAKVLEYVQEKAAGIYGGSGAQRRKFAARLSFKLGLAGWSKKESAPW